MFPFDISVWRSLSVDVVLLTLGTHWNLSLTLTRKPWIPANVHRAGASKDMKNNISQLGKNKRIHYHAYAFWISDF